MLRRLSGGLGADVKVNLTMRMELNPGKRYAKERPVIEAWWKVNLANVTTVQVMKVTMSISSSISSIPFSLFSYNVNLLLTWTSINKWNVFLVTVCVPCAIHDLSIFSDIYLSMCKLHWI